MIAAKNPDPEEIKYEIADFLYHMMVMMVDKGITWDEVLEELSSKIKTRICICPHTEIQKDASHCAVDTDVLNQKDICICK